MTNEEKAKVLALNLYDDGLFYHNYESQKKEIQSAIMKMAEWKDEQIRQYLNDCIKKAHAVNSPNMAKLLEKMKNDLNL